MLMGGPNGGCGLLYPCNHPAYFLARRACEGSWNCGSHWGHRRTRGAFGFKLTHYRANRRTLAAQPLRLRRRVCKDFRGAGLAPLGLATIIHLRKHTVMLRLSAKNSRRIGT